MKLARMLSCSAVALACVAALVIAQEPVDIREDLKVESLTEEELGQISIAEEELTKAEAKYQMMLWHVKQAHGATQDFIYNGQRPCDVPVKDVQIRGHYAFITKRPFMPCSSPAFVGSQTIIDPVKVKP